MSTCNSWSAYAALETPPKLMSLERDVPLEKIYEALFVYVWQPYTETKFKQKHKQQNNKIIFQSKSYIK